MEQFAAVMEPGQAPPVDDIPILKYIPASMAQWKRNTIQAGKDYNDLWAECRRRLDARRATGVRRNCVTDLLLDEWESKGWPMTNRDFDITIADFVAGGADTTASQVQTLCLAFAKWPEVQKRAREQIDAVCGTDRSPVWQDFAALPYINQIVKEGMRWRPV